jgi:hypothetical protein
MWWQLVDASKMDFININNYPGKGALSSKGIRSAVIEEASGTGSITKKFGGVFFNNYTSIYRFYDNEVNDILEGRLLKHYQGLPNSYKENCIIGFYPNRKEVYFLLGGEIWVYNLTLDNWKPYNYSALDINKDTRFINFILHPDGELRFGNDDNKLFITSPIETDLYLDEGTMPIDCFKKQYLNNGTNVENKIPDKLAMIFDNILNGGPGLMDIQIGRNDETSAALLDKAGFDISKGKFSLFTPVRSRCNWYWIYDHTDGVNFQRLRITEMNINAKIAGRLGTHI